MFQYRSNNFGPRVSAIQKHLGAVEKELAQIGRIAGRRGSSAAAVAGDRIGETVSGILGDMIERFRDGGQAASDGATRLGSGAYALGRRYGGDALDRAVSLGRSYGGSALDRVSAQTEDRPLLTLGVALGVGVLIGAAVLGSMSGKRGE